MTAYGFAVTKMMNGESMNNFKKQVRIAMVMLITLTLLLSIAIPVLAAEQETQPSGWNDPMLYVFMAVVVCSHSSMATNAY